MNNDIFYQLAVVLGLSSLFSFLIRKLNLPALIGYLFVGILISALTSFNLQTSSVGSLPFIGIAFVLFLIGMELDFREIKTLGKTVFLTCLVQVIISAIAGITLANLFGFRGQEAQYLGIGLSFSSTIVIVKLLLEKKGTTSLYGKLSIGVTLLEDIAALLILMYLSLYGSVLNVGMEEGIILASLVAKGLMLLFLTFIFAKFILNRAFNSVSNSSELLFLTSLTWCFISISLALLLGFSVVIGAFLAGLALASSPYHYHISSKVKPLRDFFIVLFFVYLGTLVGIGNVLSEFKLIIVFIFYALFIKPFIFALLFGSFGFRKHTIFQSSVNFTQISEFSLIILLTGVQKGVVSDSALSVMSITVASTIFFSSIIITHSKSIYRFLNPVLDFFEQKNNLNHFEERPVKDLEDHVVLIGAGRVGRPISDFLEKSKIPFIILDFNPETVKSLQRENLHAIYGDLSDPEVLDELYLDKSKLIISTATDENDNKTLLSEISRRKIRAKVVIRATEENEISQFKKRGADYVLFPETVSADFLVSQLKINWPNIHFSSLN